MTAVESLGEIESPAGVLRCTLKAFENINIAFGSYGEAYRRVGQMDAAAMAKIVEEGAGMKFDDAKVAVWRLGPQSLTESLGKYLTMLSNGGKMPSEAGDAPKGEA